ncbi:hypothetical protein HMPREF1624_01093 [Sporothrix schenckii ATCC 58251]|uniref:Uncharacterized protein n=1 Tax=Sporothrix schenckii (strain ATCC 58251 / de Perez 2211183) TaxID=1391915 RepID=U7Q7S1_SPOS1|nr:hypothetical protein HMPREF1624_01093 [Sporothrix schenckii ATCC 58251]
MSASNGNNGQHGTGTGPSAAGGSGQSQALTNSPSDLNKIVDSTARGPIEPYSFEAIARRAQNADLDEADVREGIPGVFTGVSNRDILDTHAALKLGPLPMELELRDDVRAELEEQDQRQPPAAGVPSLVSEFDAKIKQEEGADGPSRTDLPLPPSRARDVVIEMQKIRETRDRFQIEDRTGGVGVPVSVCMFTFHNTCGSGLDGTLRLWDINLPKDASKTPAALGTAPGSALASSNQSGDIGGTGGESLTGASSQDRSITVGGQPPSPATAATAAGAASGTNNGGAGKKKGKEVTITPDQISAFATKKTPILRAEFTRMNLVVASGCFDP